jgi:hypothetical protein
MRVFTSYCFVFLALFQEFPFVEFATYHPQVSVFNPAHPGHFDFHFLFPSLAAAVMTGFTILR